MQLKPRMGYQSKECDPIGPVTRSEMHYTTSTDYADGSCRYQAGTGLCYYCYSQAV